MDKKTAQELSRAVQDALAPLGLDRGLVVRVAGGRFDATCLTIKVELAERSGDGLVLGADAVAFQQLARLFGLQPEDLGREFTDSGGTFRVIGLRPRSPRFPVICRDMGTLKNLKMPAERVARALQAVRS